MKTDSIEEQEKRINKIIANIDKNDIMKLLKAWKEHLENVLVFPFEAIIIGYMDKGPLRSGDKVRVKSISAIDDLYGVIVELRYGRKRYDHPLDDIEIIEKDGPNFQHVDDYSVWMANR